LIEFTVEPESEVIVKLTWSPDEVGGCRETVYLKSDQICRLQFIIVGVASTESRPGPAKVCDCVQVVGR
jgi:hypothetical protein